MNREQLIQSIVARKLASGEKNKVGCVPCFGFGMNPVQKASRQPAVKVSQ